MPFKKSPLSQVLENKWSPRTDLNRRPADYKLAGDSGFLKVIADRDGIMISNWENGGIEVEAADFVYF